MWWWSIGVGLAVGGVIVLVLQFTENGRKHGLVKGLVLGLMGAYKKANVKWLNWRGLTPTGVVEERVVTGKSWEEFCDTLKAAGASMMAPGTPKDAFNQAEGYRYLSRLLRAGLESFLECSDPAAPQLVAIANGSRTARICIGSDNPDNLYQNAIICGQWTYRVYGNRGTVHYLGFGTQAGVYGSAGGLSTVDYLEAKDIKMEPDGSFELILGPKLPQRYEGVNYLKTASDPPQGVLIVRQTFLDRTTEAEAIIKIDRIDLDKENDGSDDSASDNVKTKPTPITAETLDAAFQNVGLFVGGASMMFATWANGFQKHINQLPLFDQKKSDAVGGDPHIRYYHSYWKLDKDECLVIDADPHLCKPDHWNFQLNNHWMESLDYRYFNIHVNKHSARYRSDGSVRIIVAHESPSSYLNNDSHYINWIDTVQHDRGTMCFRWIKPGVPDPELPHPKTRTMKLQDLKNLD